MDTEVALRLAGLGKAYQIYSRPVDRLKQMLWRGRKRFYREFWAVRGLDLEVRRGETVGIVGRNGSGKSTLLHMVCGTLQPSEGTVKAQGRLAALLELGSGFNPEFSGRENVALNAAILGLTDQQIKERYESIVAFADIGAFIEQPVKSYSSGMYARLAFAVAVHVDPDVLVVDEILSVGDEAFKRKCFARLEDFRKKGGTVLFVSHSAASVLELCDRAVLLERGQRLLTSDPKTVIDQYHKLLYAPLDRRASLVAEIREIDTRSPSKVAATTEARMRAQERYSAPESSDGSYDPGLQSQSNKEYPQRGARISNVRILNRSGQQVNVLEPGGRYRYTYEVAVHQTATRFRAGMLLKTVRGVELGGMATHPFGKGLDVVRAGTRLRVSFEFCPALAPGSYFLNAGVKGWVDGEEVFLHRILDVAMFRIDPRPSRLMTGYVDFSGGETGKIELAEPAAKGDGS